MTLMKNISLKPCIRIRSLNHEVIADFEGHFLFASEIGINHRQLALIVLDATSYSRILTDINVGS